jgi:hypothetical protein
VGLGKLRLDLRGEKQKQNIQSKQKKVLEKKKKRFRRQELFTNLCTTALVGLSAALTKVKQT